MRNTLSSQILEWVQWLQTYKCIEYCRQARQLHAWSLWMLNRRWKGEVYVFGSFPPTFHGLTWCDGVVVKLAGLAEFIPLTKFSEFPSKDSWFCAKIESQRYHDLEKKIKFCLQLKLRILKVLLEICRLVQSKSLLSYLCLKLVIVMISMKEDEE